MVVDFADLPGIRRRHKEQKLVLAGGVFDILHAGHVDFLQDVCSYGDVVVLAVANDKRVAQRKGSIRPVRHQDGRAAVVAAMRCVDYVFVAPEIKEEEGETTSLPRVLRQLRPDVVVSHDARTAEYETELREIGCRMVTPPIRKHNSTTNIINTIVARYDAEHGDGTRGRGKP
ncbi:MAG: adenylyltransferase/cytidyltransferase family protein [Verrucomicrobia bacterium]|jgi:rfaE bifunctional protein nucleotidyltransferase chain/domain|nr:adenylyltransferase/cytidyltransferase family protein [Verrucomicrobiota bacterium]